MSRVYPALEKLFAVRSAQAAAPDPERASEFAELIERLFQETTAVALIGSSFGKGVTKVCEGIAAELSESGKRVVIVSVNTLLQLDTSGSVSPEAIAAPLFLYRPRRYRRVGKTVWLWPSLLGQQIDTAKTRVPVPVKSWLNWLGYLKQDYDVVLLDCPPLEISPGGAAIAAMANAAVLGVDAMRTTKQQILLDQHLLEVSGVKLAGCILIV